MVAVCVYHGSFTGRVSYAGFDAVPGPPRFHNSMPDSDMPWNCCRHHLVCPLSRGRLPFCLSCRTVCVCVCACVHSSRSLVGLYLYGCFSQSSVCPWHCFPSCHMALRSRPEFGYNYICLRSSRQKADPADGDRRLLGRYCRRGSVEGTLGADALHAKPTGPAHAHPTSATPAFLNDLHSAPTTAYRNWRRASPKSGLQS